MGKRRRYDGGGGRSPGYSSILNSGLLEQRISDAGLIYSDPSVVVGHLRSSFSDYNRLKHAPFLRSVAGLLQHLRQRPSEGDDDHARRNHRSSSSSSLAEAVDNDDSTSDEDAVSEAEQIERTSFDITKSMLRTSYTSHRTKAAPAIKMMAENVNGPTAAVNVTAAINGPRFRDLGGMKDVIKKLMIPVIIPLRHPQLLEMAGLSPISGILLHGPPGCGKTTLARAIANETGVPFYEICATEVISGISGVSEESIRDHFKKAYDTAPSIIFIDEIDAIASKRESLQREMERRIVTQLMTCMDSPHQKKISQKKTGHVLVIGATNRPDAIDQALRRPGRFDREITLGYPDENARLEILSVLTRSPKLEANFDLSKIASSTPGFAGADLDALVKEAGFLALEPILYRRASELDNNEDWWQMPWNTEDMKSLMESFGITMANFEEVAKTIQPSSRREGFSSVPNVKWEDVGGLNPLRIELERYIVQPIKNPRDFKDFGLKLGAGFLLHGPPGCGKTLIAQAVANEAGASFIYIKGPELLNKYVGESEHAVRTLFSRARTCSPCIVFLDEVDALTTKRGEEGGWVVDRLVNQLLIELEDSQRHGVYVIAATNRLEVMDPAVLRPGRFGKILYVPLPSPEERGLILKALARNLPIDVDVDLDAIGRSEACKNFSGADLDVLMQYAARAAFDERLRSREGDNSDNKACSNISSLHFEQALQKKRFPSVSQKERRHYEKSAKKLCRV